MPARAERDRPMHFVFVRAADGGAVFYLNGAVLSSRQGSRVGASGGKKVFDGKIAGDLSNWNDRYALRLANEGSSKLPQLFLDPEPYGR